MAIQNEYRVARSTPSDSTFNALDLKRRPSLAVMEFLDPGDSQYFANTLKGKEWRDVTPEPHKSRKTLEHVAPQPGELEAFLNIEPDWMYLSGHYGRSYYHAPNKTLTVLPAGFFNEPFHLADWESAWTKKAPQGIYLQAESLEESGAGVFRNYIKAQQLVHQDHDFHSLDERPVAERVEEWAQVWREPIKDGQVSALPVSGNRGLLFTHTWEEVKVLLLVCCNALVWNKNCFHKSFPNALVLGWVGKNPANAVPIIKQFLVNAFRDVKDSADPIMMDHDHIAAAWTDVHYKQGLFGAGGLGYMKPSGEVFGVTNSPDKESFIGNAGQVTAHWARKDNVFAFGINNSATDTEP